MAAEHSIIRVWLIFVLSKKKVIGTNYHLSVQCFLKMGNCTVNLRY